MNGDVKIWVLLAIVASATALAMSWNHSWKGPKASRREWLYRGLMAICAGFGIWAFTLFGEMHNQGAFGRQDFHAHDCYHYYFGSKYLKEWGYDGMYFATVAVLEEIGREEPRKAIRFRRIRDLDGSARFLYREDFEPKMAEARARFTPERWAGFKKEMSFLRELTMNNDWWHGVMLDNGFNPPPSYAAITGPIANRVPFDARTWKWLGTFDWVLMGAGVLAIGWALGIMPALFTLVVMGNAPITTFNWTGGSFFRQLWLFLLMIGLSCVARKKWYAAGAALGACTAAVFFPIFFLVGSMVPLAYRWRQGRGYVPLARMAIGAASAIAVLIGLSLLIYGGEPWWQWWHRIVAHDLTFFDNHIGLKKITTFAREVGGQAFGASDTVYPEWNRALVMRAHRGGAVELLLAVVLSGLVIAGNLRSRPAEACLVIGSGLLVIWTMPAGYYTVYAGAFAAFMLANRTEWGVRRFALIAIALLAAIAMRRFDRDLITQSFLLSVGWLVSILALSAMSWLEHPVFHQTAEKRQRTVGIAAGVVAALCLTLFVIRDLVHPSTFLPTQIVQSDHLLDTLDLGADDAEVAHSVEFHDPRLVGRDLMDTFGYLVDDDCRILRKGEKLVYDLAAAPKGGALVVRTDSFYAGDLLTTVNGRVLAPVYVDPHRTLFAYVRVPLPADLGDGPLHVQQETTSNDVGLFAIWLLSP